MSGSVLARGFALNFGFNLLATVISSLGMVVVVATYEPGAWGSTAATLAAGQFFGGLLSFGTPLERIRRYSRVGPDLSGKMAYSESEVRLVTASIVVLMAVFATFINPTIAAVAYCAAGVFASLGAGNYFISQKRYVSAGVVVLAEKIITVTIILVTLGWAPGATWILPVAYGTAGLVAGVCVLFFLAKERPLNRPAFTLSRIAHQWRGAFYLGLSSVAPAALLLDVTIVLAVSSDSEAGLFAVGSKLVAPLSIAATSIVAIALPHLSAKPKGVLPAISGKRTWAALGFFLGGLTVAFVSAPWWIVLLFGRAYADSVWPVRFYILNVTMVLATRALVTILQAWDDDRFAAGLVLAQVIFALVGVGFGASVAGAFGASIAVFATNVALAAALYHRMSCLRVRA